MKQLTEERVREIVREEIEKEKAANATATLKQLRERLSKSYIPEDPWGINHRQQNL
ncbi:hypothetical protein ACFQ3W_25650 [Paenibacillus puldeungensis]|uniref:Uncharacterized protein n=1 Tax=Paenibacillus puldeungensis TaxID=696536 RepID=A0ABW3S500_9BACL